MALRGLPGYRSGDIRTREEMGLAPLPSREDARRELIEEMLRRGARCQNPLDLPPCPCPHPLGIPVLPPLPPERR